MTRGLVMQTFKAIYVIAVIATLAWYVGRLDLSRYPWAAWVSSPGPYAFVLGWIAMATLLGVAWARVVRCHLGLALPAREWLPLQAMAWLGRYLPGKLGLLAGKLALLQRHAVSARALGITVLYEQLAFVGAGLALAACMPALALGIGAMGTTWDDTAALRGFAALLLSVAVIPVMRVVGKWANVDPPDMTFCEACLPLWYLAAHGVAGTGLYLCLAGLPQLSDGPTLAYAIGLLAAANVAGIIVLFAPAGLGAREAVLVVGLAPWMSLEAAVIAAAMLRGLSVVADVAFWATALISGRVLARRALRRARGT